MDQAPGGGASRIAWLDLVRGCAAIVVATYHYRDYLGVPWLDAAFVAVDVFFVLSGIVLARRYAGALAAGLPFADFALARIRRLYPMVLLAGLFVLALDALGVQGAADPRFVSAAAGTGGWRIFTLLPSLDPASGLAFPADVPLWSLALELACNVVWFVVMRVGGRRAMAALAGGALAGYLVVAARMHTLDLGWVAGVGQQCSGLMRACGGFAVGVLVERHRPRVPGHPLVWAVGLAAGLVDVAHVPLWFAALLPQALGVLLLVSLVDRPPPSMRLAHVARPLAMASYPLYLLHAPAARLMPSGGSTAQHWLAVVGIIGGLTLVATPVNEWLVRIAQGRRRAAAGVPVHVA